jgi:hypothetical protein
MLQQAGYGQWEKANNVKEQARFESNLEERRFARVACCPRYPGLWIAVFAGVTNWIAICIG